MVEENKEFSVHLPFKKFYISIIKDGYVGFDEFYTISEAGNINSFNPEELKHNIKTIKNEDFQNRNSELKRRSV